MTALLERTSLAELAQRQVRALDVMMDLDGCGYWFDQAFDAGCKVLGLMPADVFYSPATRWEFYEDRGMDLQQFLDTCDVLADHGLLWNWPVMAGFKTMWDAIIDAGHRLHVKTDRSFGSHPAASEVGTRLWLRYNGLHATSVTFGKDKTAGEVCDVGLEDRLDNYDDLDDFGTVAYLIDRPWNQPDGADVVRERPWRPRRRIKTHDEFAEAVLLMGTTEGP